MDQKVLSRLREAVDGLQYPCAVEAPLTVVAWDHADHLAATLKAAQAQDVLFSTIKGSDAAIGEATVAEFFADCRRHAKTGTAGRWQALRHTIESTLSDIKVYRFGKKVGTIYVVGRLGDGFAGLHARFDYGDVS